MFCLSRSLPAFVRRANSPSFHRCMSTAIAATGETKPPSSEPGFFSKVSGWLPLAAIGGTVALSKELLILNEEILILFTFSTTVFGLYTQIGGVVGKTLDDRAEKIASDLNQVLQQSAEATKQQIESAKNSLTLQEDITALFQQQQQLMTRYIAAIPNQLRANLNAQINARLSMIAEKENRFMQELQVHLADSAAAAVREQLKTGNQKALFHNAIKVLETGGSVSKEDPVRDQFAAYFSKFQKKVSSNTGKEITLNSQQKQEWKAALDDLFRRDPNLKQLDVKIPDKITL